MSSEKIEIKNKILKENKELFGMLERLDRNGHTNKIRMNFTIDKEVSKNFRDYCKDKGFSMSRLIEKKMLDIISNT